MLRQILFNHPIKDSPNFKDFFMKLIKHLFIVGFSILLVNCRCKTEEYEVFTQLDLKKNFYDTLYYNTDKKLLSKIEIRFLGYIEGEGIVEIDNGGGRFNKVKIQGNINQEYESEWYDRRFIIRYTPVSNVKGGKLIVKYRVY